MGIKYQTFVSTVLDTNAKPIERKYHRDFGALLFANAAPLFEEKRLLS
jgi:hypothetical protein